MEYKESKYKEYFKDFDEWEKNEFNERIRKVPIDYNDTLDLYDAIDISHLLNRFIKLNELLIVANNETGTLDFNKDSFKNNIDLYDYCKPRRFSYEGKE